MSPSSPPPHTARRLNHHHQHYYYNNNNNPSAATTSYQQQQQQHPFTHPSSDWDGTLSATVFDWISHLRHTLFPQHSPHLSLSPSPHHHHHRLPTLIQNAFKNHLSSPGAQDHQASTLWFATLCALWYSSSALSSNSGKVILTRFRFPVTLTIVQFAFVALWSGLCLALRHHSLHPSSLALSSNHRHHHGTTLLIQTLGIRIPNRTTIRGTCIMSLFSIAGHVFSSMAISRVPVSTVHTIKALSPLFTVIAYTGLFGVRYGFNTYLSLLPLTLGVMLACSFDMRANGVGFLCALGSTIIFVSQNIFGKKLLPKENNNNHGSASGEKGHKRQSSISSSGAAQMDKLNLLFYSSAIAFLMMIPIWIYTDLGALWTRDSAGEGKVEERARMGLTSYFIFNGTVHFAQCILAFSILSRTSPVTYSIASLIKRVAVICIAILWFGQPVSAVQAFGMLLTFVGLFIYNQAKAEIDRGEKRRGIIERRQEVLLPSTNSDLELLPEEEEEVESEQKNFVPSLLANDLHKPSILFENPFRRESLNHTSVQLNSNSPLQSNSSSRAINPSSTTTRQRAPSIPTPVSFINDSPSNAPHPPYPQHHSYHHPPASSTHQQQRSSLDHKQNPIPHPFSSSSSSSSSPQPHHSHLHQHHHPPPPPLNHHHPSLSSNPRSSSLKSSLQESNPLLRPIVNVR